MKLRVLFATVVISICAAACKKAAAPASTATVSITIFPTTVQTVLPGGTVSFSATVSNTTNTSVTWEVNGASGGDITVGTVSTTGLYTAPTNVISPFSVTVTAVAAADTSKFASTTVSIVLPPAVILSPTAATVAAGASQQFTATVQQNAPVTWKVNNIVGGNATFGTITQAGLYTAPQVPPPGGPVSISAVLQSDSTKFGLATAVDTYSNFSLRNSYAFSLRGSDPSGLLLRAGSLTADGNGNITAGMEDINNGINLVQAALSFTGTYSIGPDGRGTVTFTDGFNGNTAGAGNSKFSIVIVSAKQAQMEELDTFAAASGEADLQMPTSFNTAAFRGEYTFDFSGVDTATKPISVIGQFLADGIGGGTAESALQDTNDNGTLTSNAAVSFSYQSVAANGRGMATLNGSSYSFYMISADRAQFIALGNPASSPVVSGAATVQQVSTFVPANLGGNFLLVTNGNSTTGPISTVATFFSDGASKLTNGLLNQNDTGVVSSGSFTGTYTIAPNGRGTASFSSGQAYVFYLIGVNQAVFQETDNSIVSDGLLQGLAGGPFSTSNLSGGYALQLTGVAAGQGEQDILGQLNTANGLIATGAADVNTANSPGSLTAFTPASGVAIPSGTTPYQINNGQGTMQITLSGTTFTFKTYFLSSNTLFLLRSDRTDARVLHGNLFQNVSLAPAITSANSATFVAGAAGTFTVVASGSLASTLSESGPLPSGVTFNAQSGVLSGTSASGTAGTYPIQFTASNGVGSNAVQNFTLTVVNPGN
jgi:Putative Ig domain